MPTNPMPPQNRANAEARKELGEKLGKTRPHSPAAQRALAEAAARRATRERARTAGEPKEVNGRDGPGPTRFGDWEVNGLASDF